MTGWSCASCGQTSPLGTRFCGHCGAPAVATGPVQTWSCRDCGTTNPQGNAFCAGCGAQAQAARAEELRLVTALFADISGFTTLADRLDVESLHDVITPLLGGLTRIAERYDGFVEKFAGDALLVVYGVPVTHEDDAQRALLTALDMHSELPRLLAELGAGAAELTIHIGVNTGRVIGRQAGSAQQSDYAVLGDSVILAQRLESACPPGQTYVGPPTYTLCKEEFELESVGELTLKGKLKPVEAFRLLGRRVAAREAARPLVGRDVELAALDAALERTRSGQGVTAIIVGEPGSGKSRLVAEARAHAVAGGTRWLAARCLSYGASLPYWPFADLLRQFCGVSVEDTPTQAQARLVGQLPTSSLPGAYRLLGLAGDGVDPQRARREIHDGVTAWLTALAAESPVTLCLEDVHWADRASLELVGELLRATRPGPVAVLLITRPEAAAELDSLVGEAETLRLALGPLDAAVVPTLAGALLGAPPGPALLDLLMERTAGNPLFVEELTCSLRESGALVQSATGWEIKPGWDLSAVPQTVERVFAARLDALPVAAAGLLQVTAVIGRRVRRSLLQAVAGADFPGLDPLESLLDAGLLDAVVDSGESAVTFHHALLHDVVYGRLLRRRRRELHRRVADVARSLYGDGDDSIGLLARHLYLAEAGTEAAEALLRAGRRAAALYANDEAALHLERAVEVLRGLPEEAERLPGALLELAEIQQIRGEYDDAYSRYDEVRLMADDVHAWQGLAAVLRKRGQYDQALDLLALTAHQDACLLLEKGYSLRLAGEPAASEAVLRRAFDTAADRSHEAGLVLLELATTLDVLDRLEEADRAGCDAIALFASRGEPGHEAAAHRVAGGVARRLGRYDDAAGRLEQAEALATRTGRIEEAAGVLLNLGMLRMDLGDGAGALACTSRAVEVFDRLGHGSGRAVGYGNLADCYARLGNWEEAQEWCDRAVEHAARIGHAGTLADAMATLCRVRIGQQRWSEAAVAGDVAVQRLRALGAETEAQSVLQLAEQARREAAESAGRPTPTTTPRPRGSARRR